MSPPLLLLSDADVRALLTPEVALAAAEAAFRSQGEGTAIPPQSIGLHATEGGFHVKAALHRGEQMVFAAKVNANFPGNPAKHGLPTIQGALYLADAERGIPLAVMASGWITAMRTAAASAVAVKYLGDEGATVAAIIGCGVQGRTHIPFLRLVRGIKEIRLADADPKRAERLAAEMAEEPGVRFTAYATPAEAARGAQIIVTCTTSTVPILGDGDIAAGACIAAVGADNPQKWEIAPSLMARSAVVCDLTSQCAEIGDLHHAIAAGAMRATDVRAQLGEIVAGKGGARRSASEVAIFDSTGTALLDVTAALAVHRAAMASGRGQAFSLSG